MEDNRAMFKYNGGKGALLCSECRVILKTGSQYSELEKQASRGKIQLEAYYCEKCKPKKQVCEYSGLRSVEGYQEEIDKEIKKAIIANLDTEEGKELVEVFRRGWLAGYNEGLYDKEAK